MLHPTPLTKHTTADRQGYTSFILTNKEIRIYYIARYIVQQLYPTKRQDVNVLILKLLKRGQNLFEYML